MTRQITNQYQDKFSVTEYAGVFHWRRERPNGTGTVSREAWLTWDECYDAMTVVAECYGGVIDQFDIEYANDQELGRIGRDESLRPYLY